MDRYISGGLSGLANLGNTCFMNSCMQIISHTYELNDFLDSPLFEKKLQPKKETVLLVEWNNLRKLLWSKNCVVAPHRFVRNVQQLAEEKDRQTFTGFSQNDLPEFLLFVIDCFHTSLSRKINMKIKGETQNERDEIALKCFEMIKTTFMNDYSEIWNLFYGVHVSEIVLISSKKVASIRPEPYFIIDLPIPSNNKLPSIYDCFDLYVSGEILEGDNVYYNEETNTKESAQKQIKFWSFPSILVVDFKRFNWRNDKNKILIDFPLENLDLSKYVIGYKNTSYIYDLYGVCNHSGGVLGGHYTAYIKNANQLWYHFNDTSVSEVGLNENIVSPKAYCLFYRKRKTK